MQQILCFGFCVSMQLSLAGRKGAVARVKGARAYNCLQ